MGFDESDGKEPWLAGLAELVEFGEGFVGNEVVGVSWRLGGRFYNRILAFDAGFAPLVAVHGSLRSFPCSTGHHGSGPCSGDLWLLWIVPILARIASRIVGNFSDRDGGVTVGFERVR